MEIEYPEQGLSSALSRLELIGSRLRLMGLAVFASTLVNLLIMVVVWFVYLFSRFSIFFTGFRTDNITLMLFVQVISVACALLFTVLHESRRKQGDTLFEEISDELQWNVRGAELLSEGNAVAAERPALQTRLVLRTFARASDLPLVPGKFGAAIYVAVNLLMLFSEYLRFTKF